LIANLRLSHVALILAAETQRGAGMSSDEADWVKVAERGDLGEGDVLGIVVGGHDIAIYDLDGEIYATDDICTHAYAKLSDGWLDKGEIECPLHAGRFDVKTGKATAPPCIDDLKTFPVRVVDDEIQVKLT
jgi:naphthalene 1,2-dioxygenase system ferredoxin subunit